ncbi:MAG: hypothetical protein IIC20_00840 [Chloroflexi bacterium]|nr:hypothetical protein [Chloroflexota bacterium]
MASKRNDRDRHPFTPGQRLINVSVGVAAGLAVMAATENLALGFLTFLGVWILFSAFMLSRQRR